MYQQLESKANTRIEIIFWWNRSDSSIYIRSLWFIAVSKCTCTCRHWFIWTIENYYHLQDRSVSKSMKTRMKHIELIWNTSNGCQNGESKAKSIEMEGQKIIDFDEWHSMWLQLVKNREKTRRTCLPCYSQTYDGKNCRRFNIGW